MSIPIALTIAGSDSSGGAGVQADLKTFSALGVYGASVITALTAQSTTEVRAIHDVPASFVKSQLETVFADLIIDVVKIGMLSQADIIWTVADHLRRYSALPIVLDPVMVSKSGAPLLQSDAIDALNRHVVPLATVITPNVPEVARMLEISVENVQRDGRRVCERLLAMGPKAVVLKGGHGTGGSSDDWYYDGCEFECFPSRRIETTHTHGTGCTFASAIAAHLARGFPLREAVREAKAYITGAIGAAHVLPVGRGHGPVHHFYEIWKGGSPIKES